MSTARPLDCHIGVSPLRDASQKEAQSGEPVIALIQFAIPDMGILFRCRDQGNPFDLEVTALCSALQYLLKELDQPPDHVRLFTSKPELVFALTRPDLAETRLTGEQRAFLSEVRTRIKLSVRFIERELNRSFCAAVDFPSIPQRADRIGEKTSGHSGSSSLTDRSSPKREL